MTDKVGSLTSLINSCAREETLPLSSPLGLVKCQKLSQRSCPNSMAVVFALYLGFTPKFAATNFGETSKTSFNNDQPRVKQVLVKLLLGRVAECLIYSLDQQSVKLIVWAS